MNDKVDNARKPSSSTPAVKPHTPQPQWDQFAVLRDYAYTHTQPQWADVLPSRASTAPSPAITSSVPTSSSSRAWTPSVVRPPTLEAPRVCTSCHRAKHDCTCKTCFVCQSAFLKNRHHCRRCWHAVCSSCWGYQHYVHMLGRPMPVCDRCSVPWALANASKRDESGLRWGLYALRIAGEMPRMCIAPSCRTFTRRLVCYRCGMPTVVTQPHAARLVRVNGIPRAVMDAVNVLDMEQLSLRAMEVDGMTSQDVERVFRRYFHHFEELLAFRAVTTAKAAQCILLANVAAATAYEYVGCPNITLGLSDVPYAKVLQVVVAKERYTVLEAPGRIKFITFPGTHNWRTWRVDMRFSRVRETVWTRLHDGVREEPPRNGSDNDARRGRGGGCPPTSVPLCGGVRKTWEYQVHGGFAQEAQEVGLPLDTLLDDVRSGGYTLVLCGHSLGGAIAQYLTLDLLHRAAATLAPAGAAAEARILCVTFGAPLLGNYELADHVEACGWAGLFHNFVYRSDVVPRVFCTDELAWDAQSRLFNSLASVVTAAQDWWRGKKNATVIPGSETAQLEAALAASNEAASPTGTTDRLGAEPASTPDGTGAVSPPQPQHRTSAASRVLRKAAALTLGLTGGLSAGTIVAEADGALSDAPTNASMSSSDAVEEARLAAYMDTAIRTSHDLLEDEDESELHGGKNKNTMEKEEEEECMTRNGGAESPACESSRTREEALRRDADVEAALSAFTSRCSRAAPTGGSRDASHGKRPRTSTPASSINFDARTTTTTTTTNSHTHTDIDAYSNEKAEGGESEKDEQRSGGQRESSSRPMRSRCDADSPPPPPHPPVPVQRTPSMTSNTIASPPSPQEVRPSADVVTDVVIPSRRLHRRFTCFGRYHFLQYGTYGYVSTADSETAFGILKHGCGEESVLRDHSVAAYNRGMMFHLYRNLE